MKEDRNKRPVVDGLTELDAIGLKKKFWDMAHNAQKVSDPLLDDKDAYVLDLDGEGWVLVCDVPTGKEPARGLIGEGLSWDQVGTKSGLSRDQVESLLKMMIKPVSASELHTQMNIVNASKFKKKYLDPLIEMGLVVMTRPEVPNSRLQQYVLTEQGKLMVK